MNTIINVDSPDVMSASSDAPEAEAEETKTEAPEPTELEAKEQPEQETEGAEGEEPKAEVEESGESSDATGDDAPAEPKKSKVQKRIDELTAKMRQAERERDLYKTQLTQSQPQPQVDVGVEPTLEGCEFDAEKFKSQWTSWQANKAQAEQQAQSEQAKQFQAQQQALSFQAKAVEFQESCADYEQVTANPSFHQSDAMYDALISADNGPQMAYHLGKNLELANAINAMPTAQALMELGRISAELSAPPPQPQPKLTSAPQPIKPVGQSAVVEKSPEDMSMDEYRAWREKKQA